MLLQKQKDCTGISGEYCVSTEFNGDMHSYSHGLEIIDKYKNRKLVTKSDYIKFTSAFDRKHFHYGYEGDELVHYGKNQRSIRDSYYKQHHDLNTLKASDSLIYTEGVVICKTDDDHPKRMTQEEWVKVDVVTIAAPDLRSKSNMYAAIVGNGTYMNNAELFGYHVKRAIHMLTVAASKGADILVLGAFGCGAFQNVWYFRRRVRKTRPFVC